MADKELDAPARRLGCSGYRWAGVPLGEYKSDDGSWQDVTRQVLFGRAGEAAGFQVRYFEVTPGGYTSLEQHEHVHAVVCVRGRGKAVVGEQCWEMGFLDAVYVAPWTPHQFVPAGDEPFGFLCIVDAERDRPRAVAGAALARLLANPQTGSVVRTPRRG